MRRSGPPSLKKHFRNLGTPLDLGGLTLRLHGLQMHTERFHQGDQGTKFWNTCLRAQTSCFGALKRLTHPKTGDGQKVDTTL